MSTSTITPRISKFAKWLGNSVYPVQACFVVLKWHGLVDWSWWYTFSPIALCFLVGFLISFIVAVFK